MIKTAVISSKRQLGTFSESIMKFEEIVSECVNRGFQFRHFSKDYVLFDNISIELLYIEDLKKFDIDEYDNLYVHHNVSHYFSKLINSPSDRFNLF